MLARTHSDGCKLPGVRCICCKEFETDCKEAMEKQVEAPGAKDSPKHEDNQIRFPHSFVGTQGFLCAYVSFPLHYFLTATSPDTSKLPFPQLRSRR